MGNCDGQQFARWVQAINRPPARDAGDWGAPGGEAAPDWAVCVVRAFQIFLVLISFLLGAGLSAGAQTPPDFRSLDAILQSATAANNGAQIPGAVVVIGHDG